MHVTLNIRLASSKDPDYVFNVDLDSEGRFNEKNPTVPARKTELGGVQRPSAERLKILKSKDLKAEEEATEQVMDTLEL